MKSDLERAQEAFSDIAESAHRDVARTQTDFLGRMGAALGAYESIFDEYPDGELPDDVREDAEGQMLALSGLAMAQLVMLRHPNDPLAAFAKSECATRDAEIERLRAENDKLMKMTAPEWYYLGDDQSSDQCRFGVHEVIDEDWHWDNPFVPGEDHIVHITTAMRGPDIWAHLHFFTDEEKDARGDDEPYSIDEYPSAAAAEAARETRATLSNKDAG